MSNYVKDVSLELSEFKNTHDGKILSAKSKWSEVLEAVLNSNEQHHSKRRRITSKWDVFFIVSSAFAVFIDPLFGYIPVIVESRKCYFWDQKLMWSFLALRSTGDVLYALDIVVFFKRSRGKGKAKLFGSARIQFFGGPHRKISKRLLYHEKLLLFLPRIFAALPVLQAILLIGKFAYDQVDNTPLFYLIPLQYSVRAYNLYQWLNEHAQMDIAIRRFLKALLDFLPFVLAAHLFGALWYYFALEAEIFCWAKHLCDAANKVCDEKWAHNYNFYCHEHTERVFINAGVDMKFLNESCAVEVTKDIPTLPFDFGIYLYALQSDLTRTRNLPMKILQCFWWGLRNLSSFGSNLQTSFHKDQIILSIVISISGLALFLVYLNARVQGLRVISKQLKLRQKKEAVYPEIIKQARNIYHLRLDLLKKVSMLEGIDKEVLKAVCDHLKPVTYGNDIFIIREGELMGKMIFIKRGSALMYTKSHGGKYVCTYLERDDFYGAELLNWAFKFASFSEVPVSTTTVLCQTKVEAFAITANHLKSVVAEYWWHFKKDFSPSQLEQFAASSLQAAWRRYHVRAKGPTGRKDK